MKKTGDWARARHFLAKNPSGGKAAIGIALRQEAQLLRKNIVHGLTSQAPGGEPFAPLSPLTLAKRELYNFSGTKALLVRGDLRNAITVIVQGDTAFVGVPRKARGKDGKELVDVARVHEFGSDPIIVPVTPKMRKFLFVLLRQAGQEPSGSGKGFVVLSIPARPFLRPVFHQFVKGVKQRFLQRVATLLGGLQ